MLYTEREVFYEHLEKEESRVVLSTTLIDIAEALGKAEQWEEKHGGVLKKVDAARVMGISLAYLGTLIKDGKINTNADGWVITRSAAERATGRPPKKSKPTAIS